MAKHRPFLDGMSDINELLVSTYTHDAETLSLQLLELMNRQQWQDELFQKHLAPEYLHTSTHYASFTGLAHNDSPAFTFDQIVAVNREVIKANPNYFIHPLSTQTYTDKSLRTVDVLMIVNVSGLPDGQTGEAVRLLRWVNRKGVWQMTKSLTTRFVAGI